jgi:PAS domain S-box-containing protein
MDSTTGAIQGILQQIRSIEHEKHFGQDILNLLPVPVFYEGHDGKYLGCNQAFCDFMGRPRDEIVSRTVFEINASPAAQESFESDQEMMADNLSFEVVERVMLRGDGSSRNVIVYKSLLTDRGEGNGIVGALLDITELKESQAREQFYKGKLVALASSFAASKEQERRLIACEIHDSISQNLALSKLKLKLLGSRVEDPDAKSGIDEIVGTIDEALQYTRTLTFELGIPILYQLGLDSALQWLTEEMRRKHSLVVRYRSIRLPKRMEDDMKAFLFRSAQELLMNVIKHADADEACLSVENRRRNITLTVEDNGRGFDPGVLSLSDLSNRSYGFFSIETIARSLGGEFSVKSDPGKGASVSIRIPLRQRPKG